MSDFAPRERLFRSFFIAGFESATHRKPDGTRVDSIAATQHDRFARQDYQRLSEVGLLAARENVRWPRFEPRHGQYDEDELLRNLRAAREYGVDCVWDLFHYGWPDDVDFWSPELVERARAYAHRVADLLAREGEGCPMVAPVNEINYQSWAGGDQAIMNPFAKERGSEMKRQLVRCGIAMADAVREVLPQARLVWTESVVNLVADRPDQEDQAESQRQGVFEAWDMIAGRKAPELGGEPRFLDVLGINYYPNNQLVVEGDNIWPGDPRYRPLRSHLKEVWERYRRPLFISETSAGGDERVPWLRSVAGECEAAIAEGIPLEGVCLYPALNYPDWQSGEWMEMGLWEAADANGHRSAYEPLREELRKLQPRFKTILARRPGNRASLQ